VRLVSAVQSTLTCRFVFPDILPSLPGPGTAAFRSACKALGKFGLTAEKLSIDANATGLSDRHVTISLLGDAVVLRVHHEWLELFIPALLKGQESALVEIATEALAALARLDEHVADSRLVIHSLAHLKLVSMDPNDYVGEHLIGHSASFAPDAFAFNLIPQEGDGRDFGRLVIARSAPFPGAVFVDYLARYPRPQLSLEFVQQLQRDYNCSLSVLGLTETQPGASDHE
jgi:hypothetical protein